MKKKSIIVAKFCLALFLCFFVFFELSGPSMSKASFSEVSRNVVQYTSEYSFIKQNFQSIKKNLFINPGEYKNIEYYKSNDPMDVREIVIVEFKNLEQSNIFEEYMQNRVDSQIKAFDGYGVEQVALLKKAIISLDVNYGFYIVCEKASQIFEVYKEQL